MTPQEIADAAIDKMNKEWIFNKLIIFIYFQGQSDNSIVRDIRQK